MREGFWGGGKKFTRVRVNIKTRVDFNTQSRGTTGALPMRGWRFYKELERRKKV